MGSSESINKNNGMGSIFYYERGDTVRMMLIHKRLSRSRHIGEEAVTKAIDAKQDLAMNTSFQPQTDVLPKSHEDEVLAIMSQQSRLHGQQQPSSEQ